MEQEIDNLESLNQEEVVEPESTEESETLTDESEELIRAKEKEYARNQKIRAEKAETELKALKQTLKETEVPKTSEVSLKDQMAIIEAKVPSEDLDEVIEFSAFKKISIAEALKTTALKAILSEKEEQRQTALAANTGQTKRAVSKVSNERLLDELASGDLPEEDIEKAAKARLEAKAHKT